MPLQDDFQREERRSILLVGLSIILLALMVSPVGAFLTSSLALLAAFWVIYALGMIIYFSDDLFHPRARHTAKAIGLTCFFVYPIAVFLAILSAAATAYMFPYASIINWAMVAVGTSYSILIGGRVLRSQQTLPVTPVKPVPAGSMSTLDEINAVFRTAAIKASRPKQSLGAVVEKIPKPAIRPIVPMFPRPSGGVPLSVPATSPRGTRKSKGDDPSPPKKPLGQTSTRKLPQQQVTSAKPPSEDAVSKTSS